MSSAGPIEIYGKVCPSKSFNSPLTSLVSFSVDKPSTLDFTSVRASLSRIVTLALDSDPSLVPISCKSLVIADADDNRNSGSVGVNPSTHGDNVPDISAGADEEATRDPDDFRFWSESQAERISKAIQEAFAVELTQEVIIADANVSALANRILVSRNLLSSG